MKIRPLASDELDAIIAIETRATDFPWSRAQFENSVAAGNQISVLDESGQVCGFTIFSRVVDEASLQNIVVDPDCQGSGRGRVLLVAGLKAMAGQGAAKCFLEVRVSNHRARALYESLGFQAVGERKAYYPARHGREDAVVMCRELPLQAENAKVD